jgi:hypothetical protein
MIINLNADLHEKPFPHARFYSIIEADFLTRCQEDAQRFPYFKIEKTRTSNPDRVWLNQQSGYLSAIAQEFDSVAIKRALGYEMQTTFLGCRTRVELCMDSVGSWLEPHTDDAAKAMTMQIYLSGFGDSTKLGGHTTQVAPNSAWAFDNKDQPVHSLDPLKYNRASIIINYVTDDWRDGSVLV